MLCGYWLYLTEWVARLSKIVKHNCQKLMNLLLKRRKRKLEKRRATEVGVWIPELFNSLKCWMLNAEIQFLLNCCRARMRHPVVLLEILKNVLSPLLCTMKRFCSRLNTFQFYIQLGFLILIRKYEYLIDNRYYIQYYFVSLIRSDKFYNIIYDFLKTS